MSCVRSETLLQSGNRDPSLDAQGGLNGVVTKAVKNSMIDTYRRCAVVTEIKSLSLVNSNLIYLHCAKEPTQSQENAQCNMAFNLIIIPRNV